MFFSPLTVTAAWKEPFPGWVEGLCVLIFLGFSPYEIWFLPHFSLEYRNEWAYWSDDWRSSRLVSLFLRKDKQLISDF